jgi:hypothetical protein
VRATQVEGEERWTFYATEEESTCSLPLWKERQRTTFTGPCTSLHFGIKKQSGRGTTIDGRMGVPNNIVISGASADRGGSRP